MVISPYNTLVIFPFGCNGLLTRECRLNFWQRASLDHAVIMQIDGKLLLRFTKRCPEQRYIETRVLYAGPSCTPFSPQLLVTGKIVSIEFETLLLESICFIQKNFQIRRTKIHILSL